jgi:hypothetical protein
MGDNCDEIKLLEPRYVACCARAAIATLAAYAEEKK